MVVSAPLEIRLLGRFAVLREGVEIPPNAFVGRQTRALLRVLISQRGSFLSKDALADALWGGPLPADPSGNLEVLVSRARRALGDASLILTGPRGYAFARDDRCRVDIEVVRDAVAEGRSQLAVGAMEAALEAFKSAVDSWGGEPLPEDVYAGWADQVRAQTQRLHLEALEGAAEAALALSKPTEAVQMSEMALVREPLRERAHLMLVRSLAAAGDRAGALRAFDTFRERFAQELGLDPSPEGSELQLRILRGEADEGGRRLGQLVRAAARNASERPDLRNTLGGTGSGPGRARALAAMALLAAGSDDYERGGRLAESALLEAGEEPGARAESLLAAAIVDLNVGLLDRSEARLREALTLFEMLGEGHGVARVLDVRAMETFMAGRPGRC